jgi:lipid A 3-O-deacylase PagL
VTISVKARLAEPSHASCVHLFCITVLNRIATSLCVCFVFSNLMFAQNPDDAPSNALRHHGWNYGAHLSGGSTVVQSSAPRFVTANHSISDVAVIFHVGRVLSSEHGPTWIRGTFEWDVSVIPVEIFWVLGSHYAGGFEAFGPRWNFTNCGRRAVPFLGLGGGMLFSPGNFPPGDTARFNFTAAIDAGAHLFLRPRRSLDVGMRVQHVSNAYLGRLNPGVPISLQLTLGYSWY